MEQQTIEQKVSSTILEKNVDEIEIEGKKYIISPPSIATLILVSEIVSTLPIVDKGIEKKDILYSVLHNAKDFKPLGDMASVLILGAKNLIEKKKVKVRKNGIRGFLFRQYEEKEVSIDRKAELSKLILENIRPTVLFKIIVKRFNDLEVSDFFAITTSLSEANLLKPTKEVVL